MVSIWFERNHSTRWASLCNQPDGPSSHCQPGHLVLSRQITLPPSGVQLRTLGKSLPATWWRTSAGRGRAGRPGDSPQPQGRRTRAGDSSTLLCRHAFTASRHHHGVNVSLFLRWPDHTIWPPASARWLRRSPASTESSDVAITRPAHLALVPASYVAILLAVFGKFCDCAAMPGLLKQRNTLARNPRRTPGSTIAPNNLSQVLLDKGDLFDVGGDTAFLREVIYCRSYARADAVRWRSKNLCDARFCKKGNWIRSHRSLPKVARVATPTARMPITTIGPGVSEEIAI